MTRTRYTINHRGREWYLSDEDTELVQYYKELGATVKAETMGNDTTGIPLTRLTPSELDNLHELSESMDWEEVTHMIRQEAQQRVNQ